MPLFQAFQRGEEQRRRRKGHAVGKIGDIFAHQGISRVIKANGNEALMDASLAAIDEAEDGDLVFTNFVDFDMANAPIWPSDNRPAASAAMKDLISAASSSSPSRLRRMISCGIISVARRRS